MKYSLWMLGGAHFTHTLTWCTEGDITWFCRIAIKYSSAEENCKERILSPKIELYFAKQLTWTFE